MLTRRRFGWLLLVFALAGCARLGPVVVAPGASEADVRGALAAASAVRKAELELALAELLLPRVAYDAGAAGEVPALLADAEPALRPVNQRAWAATQSAYGRYWLSVREPALPERVERAQRSFAAAEFAFVLPADAAQLALVQAWLGTAQMQLAQPSKDPGPHFRRARDHFTLARTLWRSLHAEPEIEAMSHQIRRLDEEWRRRVP
jgi:predicted small lipoprotein YifL